MYQKEYFVPTNPNNFAYQSDLTPYALKTDVTTDLSLYALKTDVTTDLIPYALKTDVTADLVPYALKTDVTADLAPYALQSSLSLNLAPYALKTDVSTELAPYALTVNAATDHNHNSTYAPISLVTAVTLLNVAMEMQYAKITDVATDLVPYALKTDVATDLIPYALKTDVATDLAPYALATRPITYFGDPNLATDLTQEMIPTTMNSLRFSTVIYQGSGKGVFILTQPPLPNSPFVNTWDPTMVAYWDTTPWDLEIFNNSYTHNSNLMINPPSATSDLTFICTPALPITLPAGRMATIRQINRTVSGTSLSDFHQSVEYTITLSA
jgi:hypothetical protein